MFFKNKKNFFYLIVCLILILGLILISLFIFLQYRQSEQLAAALEKNSISPELNLKITGSDLQKIISFFEIKNTTTSSTTVLISPFREQPKIIKATTTAETIK